MSRALCLAGGGARGVYQIGQIKAFLQRYGTFDALYCTSVGALNGTLLHQGDFETLINIWENINNKKIYHPAPWLALTPAAAIFSSTPLAQLIHRYIDIDHIRTKPQPLNISATCTNPIQAETLDLRTLNQEQAEQWILTSASAPLGFPTQQLTWRDNKRYTDGGPTRNYNVQNAIADGHDEVIVLACSHIGNKDIKNIIDMLEFNLNVQAVDQITDSTQMATMLDKVEHTVTLTIYKPEAMDLGQLDFNTAGKNHEKYFKIGYDLLVKPTFQVRKVVKG